MGTDIHGFVQERICGKRYANVGAIEDDRNYLIFAMLAGVRNRYGVTPISEPRGLPDDLGWKDRWEQMENDPRDFGDHSFSWLTLPEVRDWPYWDAQIEGWQEQVTFRDGCKVFRLWIDYLDSKYGWLLHRDPAAVRIVFGFDS